jgi:MSHA pilin protein MshD
MPASRYDLQKPVAVFLQKPALSLGCAGFSYIEVLMAVMILALALVPLLSQFYVGFQGNINAEIVTQATDLANELTEEIKSKRFDENEFPEDPVSAGSLGTDLSEDPDDRSTFDDVDDYNNWSQSPPQSMEGSVLSDFDEFTRSVEVSYIRINGDTWEPSSSTSFYKRVVVRVTHPKLDEKTIETIIAHY